MTIINKVGGCVALAGALLVAVSAYAVTPEQKCQETKLTAQGKLEACLKKSAAGVIGGKADASATCQMKFQDALTKAGTTCRYLDNGDGTVSDLNTGLQWEKKDNGDGPSNYADVHDADNSYNWSSSGSAADGAAYTDFLSQLNNGASTDGGAMTAITGCFAGHCDWRLPSIVELQGIVDRPCGYIACIDPAFGPTRPDVYWSATTFAGNPTLAGSVSFLYPGAPNEVKTLGLYVRAVRGGL